jgi:hypothetical protein
MNLQEVFNEPLPFRYVGSQTHEDIVGSPTVHYHEFEHGDNTYLVSHHLMTMPSSGKVHASINFMAKPKDSENYTIRLTPSSAPTKVLGTVLEITKKLKEEHGITNLMVAGVSDQKDKRNKIYKKALEKVFNRPAELEHGIVTMGLEESVQMNLQEVFNEPLPFHYTGSEPWEGITGKGTHHYHEFEHDGNTYRVQHTVFEPNPWGGVHASVAFKVKAKNSNEFTDELTPSSAPTKIFGTIGEITKRMKEKHGITSLTASGVSGKTDKRNRLYQRVIQKMSGKPTELDSDFGVVRVGLGEMLKASVAARAKELFESIVKRGDEYVVMNSKKTKVLGKHKSKKKANAQLAAIEISKKERMNENMYYRSDFTERLKNRVKEVKAGVKNPALDINNPADRSGAASAIRLSRQSDQDEVRKALKAIEGGSDELTSYIQTGNPVPGFLSRTDASGMEGRQNLVAKLVSYKGKI